MPATPDGQPNNFMPAAPGTPTPVSGDVPPPVPPGPLEAAPAKPWGFGATAGWGLLIFLASLIISGAAALAALALGAGGKPPGKLTKLDVATNGFVLAVSTLAGTPVLCGLTVLFAKLRRGMDASAYLGLRWPDAKTIFRWSLGMVVLVALGDTITAFSGKSIVVEFMVKIYETAVFVPLLWLAIIVAAPLGEEFFFRGFVFEGFRHSWLGSRGTIVVTALLWAGLHLQYDLYGIAAILIAGLFLGYARLKTGSVWLCVWLHLLMNAIASIELLVYLRSKV